MAAQAFCLLPAFTGTVCARRAAGNSAGAADKQRAIAGHAKY